MLAKANQKADDFLDSGLLFGFQMKIILPFLNAFAILFLFKLLRHTEQINGKPDFNEQTKRTLFGVSVLKLFANFPD